MLIQSHTGVIRVFPAIPGNWEKSSFRDLRTEGAFLVSAEMVDGKVARIRIYSEKGGRCRLADPRSPGKIIEYEKIPGQAVVWKIDR